MRLFGSSGIRGLVNSEITAELAISLGEALGSSCKRIVVGHDPRTSSKMLLHALISGLLSTGSEVFTAGLVTTPTLAFATRNFDCGVMITASHNPPEFNGLKFLNPDGSGFNMQQMQEIEEILAKKKVDKADWRNIKGVNTHNNAVEEHVERILKSINKTNLKVVVDCGCGAASVISPYLMRRLGCEVIALNCQPDGFFPGRNPEPAEKTLSSLTSTVISNGADLGIAHDGDADRMVAVDEKGNFVGGDSLLSLFASYEVEKSIVVPINASMAIDEVVGEAEVIRTKVGDVFISEMIIKRNADFGGEPSGTFIFPAQGLCPDGVFAAARLVELVSKEPLSEQISNLPKYPMEKGAIACPNQDKEKVLESVKSRLSKFEYKDIITEDGVRVLFDNAWALVRASGTEPKIRITIEAHIEAEAKDLYDNVYELVKRCASQ